MQTTRTSRARRASNSQAESPEVYFDLTHRPLQCLLFVLPLVLLYEGGMAVVHSEIQTYERPQLVAVQLMQECYDLSGASGAYLPSALLILILFAWHISAKQPWRVSFQAFILMHVESMVLAVPLLLLSATFPRAELAAVGPLYGSPAGPWADMLLCVGAGVYEELVFRLILVSLLTFLFIDALRMSQTIGVAVSVVLSSVLFAAHHYQPIGPDNWSAGVFAFRAAAGAYLASVFVIRGFGIAVGCHMAYDAVINLP